MSNHPHQFRSQADLPSTPLRPDKAVTQKQYREKEAECFNTLRGIIKQLTREDLQTRNEILTKVIDLLQDVLATRRKEQAQPTLLSQYDVSEALAADSLKITSITSDYTGQPTNWSQSSENTEFDVNGAVGHYARPSHAQQPQQYRTYY